MSGAMNPIIVELCGVIESLVAEQCDYMRINKLGDPEQQHSIKRARAALSAVWDCGARKQSLPEPADCDWPVCGCDPYANKVMEALEECGSGGTYDEGTRRAFEGLIEDGGHMS